MRVNITPIIIKSLAICSSSFLIYYYSIIPTPRGKQGERGLWGEPFWLARGGGVRFQ